MMAHKMDENGTSDLLQALLDIATRVFWRHGAAIQDRNDDTKHFGLKPGRGKGSTCRIEFDTSFDVSFEYAHEGRTHVRRYM